MGGNMEENNNLLPAMKDSLYAPLPDLGIDYLELGIDAVMQEGPLREVPVVKTLVALCKTGVALHERNMLRQLLAFIQELNSGMVSSATLNAHREELENDSKQAEKELGRIAIILNGQIDVFQSKVFGALYGSFLNGEILWDKFCELAEANRRMFLADYKTLARMNWIKAKKPGVQSLYQLDRLASIGLLKNRSKTVAVFAGDDGSIPRSDDVEVLTHFEITSFGRTFCQSARSVLKVLSE